MENLITDRTQEDVNRAILLNQKDYLSMSDDEKNEWNAGLKGSYNASDLNRVGTAVAYVANRFNQYGYGITVTAKTDWVENDIPTPEELEAYANDIKTLHDALSLMPKTPDAPEDVSKLTWQEANAIEQILIDVDELLTIVIQSFYYSGELYSGEI